MYLILRGEKKELLHSLPIFYIHLLIKVTIINEAPCYIYNIGILLYVNRNHLG